jgi:type II secretory pathway component PulF
MDLGAPEFAAGTPALPGSWKETFCNDATPRSATELNCFFAAFWLCDRMIVTPGQLNSQAELYHQLGASVSAGVPLIQALELAASNPAARRHRQTYIQLINYLKSGVSFTDAMHKIRGWMSEFDVALLSAGEQSGRLDESFKLLSLYYSTRASIIRDTISGLLMTAATLHVFLLIFPLSLFISCAIGILNGNYADCAPFVIEKVLVFGTLYTLIFILAFACQGQRGEAWRLLMEKVSRLIPLLGRARQFLALARLAAALEALTSAGVPVIRGWQLASSASGSPTLRQEVFSWKKPIESGVTPAELVSRCPFFPEMFRNLYHTAEHSGKIDETLHRLALYYQDEGYRTLRLFTRVMNGLIYGLVALMIAYNVVHFYMGYFNSITTM